MGVIARVPQTNIRLKHLIRVYSYRWNKPIPLIRSAADFTANTDVRDILAAISSDQLKPIGTIQKLNINTSRENNIYRTLDYEQLGKIREVYPGLPEYTADVTNVALYRSHLVDAFQASTQDVFSGASSTESGIVPCFNIYNQISPLIIKVDMLEPQIGNPTEDSARSVILWDAWLKSSNIDFSIDDANDLAVIQESSITFGWLVPQAPRVV